VLFLYVISYCPRWNSCTPVHDSILQLLIVLILSYICLVLFLSGKPCGLVRHLNFSYYKYQRFFIRQIWLQMTPVVIVVILTSSFFISRVTTDSFLILPGRSVLWLVLGLEVCDSFTGSQIFFSGKS
jgi:hypothetical protein